MSDWIEGNLKLLRGAYPEIETRVSDGVTWIHIPNYPVPRDVWTVDTVEVAFRVPAQAGEAPYGFWVYPGLSLHSNGDIDNYVFPTATPWGTEWGQFSFAPAEPWQPAVPISAGPNMLNFARGIASRLAEGR